MHPDFLEDIGYLGFTMRLKRISDQLVQNGRKLYRELGLDIEPNWYGVLLLLEKHKSLLVTEIAQNLSISHPSAIAIVRKMKTAGYLEEKIDSSDGRKKFLSLSKKAKDQMPRFKRIWIAGTRTVMDMVQNTNLYRETIDFERKLNEKGFANRTIQALEEQMPDEKDLKIVSFKEKLGPEFSRINYEWLHMYFQVEEHDREILDHPKSYILNQGGAIFFAVYGGMAVGTVALIRHRAQEYEVSKMGVVPIFKGLKIGEKLLEHAILFAQKEGKKSLFLESNRKLVPALNLYRKLGFLEIDMDPNTPYDRCDIKMELMLD